jgi:hypothetical protein
MVMVDLIHSNRPDPTAVDACKARDNDDAPQGQPSRRGSSLLYHFGIISSPLGDGHVNLSAQKSGNRLYGELAHHNAR